MVYDLTFNAISTVLPLGKFEKLEKKELPVKIIAAFSLLSTVRIQFIIQAGMFKNISTVLIWSEDFRKLSDWYKEIFDFPIIEELDHPKDTGILFDAGNVSLWIGQHSDVKGKNHDSNRHMFNFEVESVTKATEYLKSKGVTLIAEPFKAPTFDKYFATFYDLDENIIQLIGDK